MEAFLRNAIVVVLWSMLDTVIILDPWLCSLLANYLISSYTANTTPVQGLLALTPLRIQWAKRRFMV